MTPLIREMVRLVDEPETSHWVDLGVVDKHVPASRLEWERAIHMPYPRTCCVFETSEAKYAVMITTGDRSVTLAYVAIEQGRLPVYSKATSIIEVDGELKYLVGGNQVVEKAAVANVVRVLLVVCQRIFKERESYKPEHQGTKAQQANRKRKGKPQLFSWHTVTIDPPAPPSQPLGGTHASPRLHDRRGHWRKHSSGKTVWVKNCKVGKASAGVVFKDYEVAA